MSAGGKQTGDALSYPPQTWRLYVNLSAYWFALSLLWAGIITIVMQNMVQAIVGDKAKDLCLGWTLGGGAAVSTVICLVVGSLSDRTAHPRHRRKAYLLWGTLASVPALALLATAHSIPMLVLAFCMLQLTANVATSPYQAMVPDLVPRDKQGLASAYLGVGSIAGTLAGLMLCGMLYDRPGGRGLHTVCALLAAVLVGTMLHAYRRLPDTPPRGEPQTGPLSDAIASGFRLRPSENPSFYWLIASRFAINLGFYSVTEFLSYYLSDTLRVPPADHQRVLTIVMLAATGSGLIGNWPAGVLSDRTSKKQVVRGAMAITSAAALVFILTTSVQVALGGAVVFGIGWGAFQAVDWALATNLLPDGDEARSMGIWHIAYTAPQVLAPVMGGIVAHYGNAGMGMGAGYRLVLGMSLFFMLAGTALVAPIRERRATP